MDTLRCTFQACSGHSNGHVLGFPRNCSALPHNQRHSTKMKSSSKNVAFTQHSLNIHFFQITFISAISANSLLDFIYHSLSLFHQLRSSSGSDHHFERFRRTKDLVTSTASPPRQGPLKSSKLTAELLQKVFQCPPALGLSLHTSLSHTCSIALCQHLIGFTYQNGVRRRLQNFYSPNGR